MNNPLKRFVKLDNAGLVALINQVPIESRNYNDFVQLNGWVATGCTKELVSTNCEVVKAVLISGQWVPFAFLRVNRAGDLFVHIKIAREKFGYNDQEAEPKDCVAEMEELEDGR